MERIGFAGITFLFFCRKKSGRKKKRPRPPLKYFMIIFIKHPFLQALMTSRLLQRMHSNLKQAPGRVKPQHITGSGINDSADSIHNRLFSIC